MYRDQAVSASLGVKSSLNKSFACILAVSGQHALKWEPRTQIFRADNF